MDKDLETVGKPHRKTLKPFCPAPASRLSKNPGHTASVYNKTALSSSPFSTAIPLRPPPLPRHTHRQSQQFRNLEGYPVSTTNARATQTPLCLPNTNATWLGRGVVTPSESRFAKLQTRHFRRFIIPSFLPSTQEFARILREPLLVGRGETPPMRN